MHSWLNLNKLDCTNANFLVLKLQYNVTFVGGWINKGIHDIPILFFFFLQLPMNLQLFQNKESLKANYSLWVLNT